MGIEIPDETRRVGSELAVRVRRSGCTMHTRKDGALAYRVCNYSRRVARGTRSLQNPVGASRTTNNNSNKNSISVNTTT